jgi:hypothetical protein
MIRILNVVGRFRLRLAVRIAVDQGLPGDDRLDALQLVEAALRRNRAIEERERLRAILGTRILRRPARERRLLIIEGRPAAFAPLALRRASP